MSIVQTVSLRCLETSGVQAEGSWLPVTGALGQDSHLCCRWGAEPWAWTRPPRERFRAGREEGEGGAQRELRLRELRGASQAGDRAGECLPWNPVEDTFHQEQDFASGHSGTRLTCCFKHLLKQMRFFRHFLKGSTEWLPLREVNG